MSLFCTEEKSLARAQVDRHAVKQEHKHVGLSQSQSVSAACIPAVPYIEARMSSNAADKQAPLARPSKHRASAEQRLMHAFLCRR
jgi:hypothetical protein